MLQQRLKPITVNLLKFNLVCHEKLVVVITLTVLTFHEWWCSLPWAQFTGSGCMLKWARHSTVFLLQLRTSFSEFTPATFSLALANFTQESFNKSVVFAFCVHMCKGFKTATGCWNLFDIGKHCAFTHWIRWCFVEHVVIPVDRTSTPLRPRSKRPPWINLESLIPGCLRNKMLIWKWSQKCVPDIKE